MALTKIDDRGLTTPIDLLDNEKIRFGTGNDLELYHDGTNSFIGNAGTLKVQSNYVYINDADGNNHIRCEDGSYVSLHFNGSKKFETTTNGPAVSSGGTDDSKLYFLTSGHTTTRIGYVGHTRFGLDVHNGLEIRDIS